MKKLIGLFVFTIILGFGMATLSSATGDMAAPGPQSIKGDLLKIEGDFYVVKDMSGKETRMHVDQSTKLDGGFKTGDKVEAQVNDKGHAFSINHANVASGGIAASGSQVVKGDLLKIEGDSYVVKDMSGKETRLHVDQSTKLEGGPFKTGDKVEAQVSDKSHALSMNHANPAR